MLCSGKTNEATKVQYDITYFYWTSLLKLHIKKTQQKDKQFKVQINKSDTILKQK